MPWRGVGEGVEPGRRGKSLIVLLVLSLRSNTHNSLRSRDAGVARDSVVNQLLSKMDGVQPLVVPTLVIGLTNKRDLIDPGRFLGRQVHGDHSHLDDNSCFIVVLALNLKIISAYISFSILYLVTISTFATWSVRGAN
jgi:hypothetical protein